MPARPLRVLLDATAIPANRGGVGRYVDGLVGGLAARDDVDVLVACRPADADHFDGLGVQARPVDGLDRRAGRFGWEQTGFARLIRRERPDVVHSPHYTMPVASDAPVVVTVHDATFFSHPEWHLGIKRRFFRTWTRVSARRAAGVITPSAATRDELERRVGVDPARVTVALHGVDHELFRPPGAAAVHALRESLDLDGDFVAFLGTLEPRKNVTGLVRGWAAAAVSRPDPPALVLAGGAGWDDALDAAVAEVPASLQVVRTGYLDLAALPALLGGATVVAYPSFAEGFGLPVAEAMACGAAVLTTRHLALPEVGGDAVAYTGTAADEIGAALTALWDDPAARQHLRTRATVRAERFTWTASAQRHVAAYRQAARVAA